MASSKKRKKKSNAGMIVLLVFLLILLAALIGAILFLVARYKKGDTTPTKNAITSSSGSEIAEAGQNTGDFEFFYKGESNLESVASTSEYAGAPEAELNGVPSVATDALMSEYAFMYRVNDGETVFEKNINEVIFPASLTKMMTVLLAIENVEDLSEPATVTQMDIDPGWESGASQAGFSAGEVVTVEDLLYGAMLPSGADACYAIADKVSGGSDAFVELMNQKAQELGMANTHFVNCTGVHDEEHYTTIADMATLLKYAMQNETYKTVFGSLSYTSKETAEHPEGIYMQSRVSVVCGNQTTLENGVEIYGGKTGFTDSAGFCMASIARTPDGQEFILITAHAFSPLNEEGEAQYEYPNAIDAKYIYNQVSLG